MMWPIFAKLRIDFKQNWYSLARIEKLNVHDNSSGAIDTIKLSVYGFDDFNLDF